MVVYAIGIPQTCAWKIIFCKHCLAQHAVVMFSQYGNDNTCLLHLLCLIMYLSMFMLCTCHCKLWYVTV